MCNHMIYISYCNVSDCGDSPGRNSAFYDELSPSNVNRIAGPVASEARPATLGPLSFAVGPAHSMKLDQPERTFQIRGGQEHDLEQLILEVKEGQVGTSG